MGAWQPGYPPGQRQFASLFQRQPLRLEGGEPFGPITLAYESWGQPNRERSNGVLLLHGFSGDSHAAGPREPGHPTAGWWHQLIGSGRPIDTDRFWVICPNVFGGCQGSSGPSSLAADGQAYGLGFPRITIRDQVACELALADHLAIGRWHGVIGGSMGGMRALEWALLAPGRVPRLGLLATAAAASPQQELWHQLELQALAWRAAGQPGLEISGTGPASAASPVRLEGLALARSIALVSYGAPNGLSPLDDFGVGRLGMASGHLPIGPFSHRQLGDLAHGLVGLSHQHQELVDFLGRFDAHSYRALCGAMTRHDLGRDRGGVAAALARIQARTEILSIRSDRLFPADLQQAIAAQIRSPVRLVTIDSRHGHDGFLLEEELIGPWLRHVLEGSDA